MLCPQNLSVFRPESVNQREYAPDAGVEKLIDAIAQLPAVERGIYRILDSLGLSSPTQRLDAYFEGLAEDGTIGLEDVAPSPESRAARAALTSPKTKIA